jgi:hypothetical protein
VAGKINERLRCFREKQKKNRNAAMNSARIFALAGISGQAFFFPLEQNDHPSAPTHLYGKLRPRLLASFKEYQTHPGI